MPTMLQVEQLDGSIVFVAARTVWRLRETLAHEDGETRIDFAGVYATTNTPVAEMLNRLGELVPENKFLELHVATSGSVWLNQGSIARVRASGDSERPGTELRVSGALQLVTEDVSAVVDLIEADSTK